MKTGSRELSEEGEISNVEASHGMIRRLRGFEVSSNSHVNVLEPVKRVFILS